MLPEVEPVVHCVADTAGSQRMCLHFTVEASDARTRWNEA